jgi:salicylate hydroxylase
LLAEEIGGLSAANALVRRGLDVTVFEQVETLREIGTGLSLFPNGRRQLERMGLKDALAHVGAKVGEVSVCRMDGTLVGLMPITDSTGWNGVYGMHRADLSQTIAEALPATVIRTAYRCIGFEQNARAAQLTFANGTTVEADFVIGADGIQSFLQKYVVEPCNVRALVLSAPGADEVETAVKVEPWRSQRQQDVG